MEKIKRLTRNRWLTVESDEPDPHIVERCTVEVIGAALAEFAGASVQTVTINRTGRLDVPESPLGMPAFVEEDLPEYCEVVVHQGNPGGHIATVLVWVPLVWNRRFFGTAGGGNRTTTGLIPGDEFRTTTLATAVRNGFAAASTDGGVRQDGKLYDWELDEETGRHDESLIENWVHRSTHEMTLIGKAVTTAIHGTKPRYSYFQGSSGGGRQAIASALHHPSDYDGLYASDPAINWTRFVPATLWPALVMKELDNALAPAKFEAFRQGAVTEYNHRNGTTEPFTTSDEPPVFDPHQLVGSATAAGQITEADAQVMKMIWEGPRTPDGEQLWFGLRPGAESWDNPAGTCVTSEGSDGRRKPEPFVIATSWFGSWLLRNHEWDWTTITFDEFAQLFVQGVKEFAHVAVDDPDLSGLRDCGAKLLVTHGLDDQVIFSQGSRHYYERVFAQMGGVSATNEFARFFLTPGDGHSACIPSGFGIDLATAMIALMNWVEKGIAPDSLESRHFAEDGVTVDGVRVVPSYGTQQVTK
ncbi:MAG: tannase/feruloyl esterase family alpha/beta hydrolase [Actinomycetota bacterium]|nr:tannase/feruloyl esterase family alpha/beta hydrolase [Actinomycetota bacterium]